MKTNFISGTRILDYRGRYVKVKREFGPYLEGKPNLKSGSTCEIVSFSFSQNEDYPSGLDVYHAGHTYYVPWEDTELIPE